MRFNHLHEVNFALVSGTLIDKSLFSRRNGKKAVRFSVENIQFQRWGGELVQFKTVVYCMALGEIARLVWTSLEKGDRVFVQGSISWKPLAEMRKDIDGIPYGVQTVLVSDIIRMKGEDARVPTWEASAEALKVAGTRPTDPSYPKVPVGQRGNDPAPPLNTERTP